VVKYYKLKACILSSECKQAFLMVQIENEYTQNQYFFIKIMKQYFTANSSLRIAHRNLKNCPLKIALKNWKLDMPIANCPLPIEN